VDDEEYICPQGWRWNGIYQTLRNAWREKADSGVAEPPHLLPPNASDSSRKLRWQETIAWATENGVGHLIPDLPEDERYYHTSFG
jgi:hypothetical protein